ncbi:MAG: HD domain-containing protein [Bacillota bacterium]
MRRIKNILNHPKYVEYMDLNGAAELDRLYCHHDMQHMLDVARVAYIMALEQKLDIPKDVIYATALLHDIGRWKQYKDKSDHAAVGAVLAEEILTSCGFDEHEVHLMQDAIRNHRKGKDLHSDLSRIIYKSDKMSRLCIQCIAKDDCKRFDDGKLPELLY